MSDSLDRHPPFIVMRDNLISISLHLCRIDRHFDSDTAISKIGLFETAQNRVQHSSNGQVDLLVIRTKELTPFQNSHISEIPVNYAPHDQVRRGIMALKVRRN